MGECVLDANYVADLMANVSQADAFAHLQQVVSLNGAVVPVFFWNVLVDKLLGAEGAPHLTPSAVDALLFEFADLKIETLYVPTDSVVVTFARTHNLSTFETTYLILAQQRDIPLVTTNEALRTIAAEQGIGVRSGF